MCNVTIIAPRVRGENHVKSSVMYQWSVLNILKESRGQREQCAAWWTYSEPTSCVRGLT